MKIIKKLSIRKICEILQSKNMKHDIQHLLTYGIQHL